MTHILVREKLHEYIENADEKKIQAIYTLIENEIEDKSLLYSQADLDSFDKTGRDFAEGKIKGYTAEESMDRIKKKISDRDL